MRKSGLIFLLAFVVPIGFALWWWGTFADAQIEIVERGPYRYAYGVYSGDYSKIPRWKAEVTQALAAQNVARGTPVTALLDDPRSTAIRDRRVEIGYLIAAEARVAPPLRVAQIARRRVVLVRVKASPLMAPGKAYAALIDYASEHGIAFRLPTFELYRDGVLELEMPVDRPSGSSPA